MAQPGATEAPRQPPHRYSPGFCQEQNRRRVLSAAVLASALGFIDGSLVSIAMPAMRASLDASLSQGQWISNAYMLPLSALILAGGALGDRFGLARVFILGIAVFVAASLASAVAPTAATLIAARALKGIGAALMVPGSLALIYRAYPPEARGRAIGIWAAASALTTALGPILGGAVITLIGPDAWRWLFAINLPLGLVTLWLIRSAALADTAMPDKRVDIGGAVLATAGLGLLAYALTATGPASVPLSVAGLGLLAGFVLWEARVESPMMPLALFASPSFSAANLSTFMLYFTLSAILFFLPMTVIAGWGVSEAAAAAAFVPLTVLIALFSTRAGKLADQIGPGPLIGTGAAIVAVSYAALAMTAPLESFWGLVMPLMCVMGAGMSLVVAPLSAAVMGAVPDSASGAASGINNAVSRIAGLVAVAAMGAVAASAYAEAGGPAAFGAPSKESGHAAASTAGLVAIAWISAGLSALSAAVAFVWVKRPPDAQTGS